MAQAQGRTNGASSAIDLHVAEVREGVCSTRANGQSVRLDNIGTLVEPVSREAQVRVHAPLNMSYSCVNGVVSSLQQRGFSRIAFVNEG
jgi:biopolymer transport protein ExbD